MSTIRKLLLTLTVMALGLSLGYCARQAHQPDLPPGQQIAATRPDPAPIFNATPEEPLDKPALVDHTGVKEVHFEEPWFPFLDDESPDQSISIGTVSTGYMVNGKPLPMPAQTYDILPRQYERGLVYGTDEMISLIQHAGQRLHQRHGTRLWLGNIGRQGGGDIHWSVSHNSGRDADLAFCYTDPDGKPVVPPDLLQLNSEGRSLKHGGFYRFDAARTWTLVKSLLTWKGGYLQYIFISNPLKNKLLKHARRLREPGWLIARADGILTQPGGALPHDDHLHIRLYCSAEDLAGGCINLGQVFPEAAHSKAVSKRLRQIAGKMKSPDATQRAHAIERLALSRARGFAPAILGKIEDPDSQVRASVARALRTLGTRSLTPALAKHFAQEEDAVVMAELLRTLGTLGGGESNKLLARVILDPTYDQATLGILPRDIASSYVPADSIPAPTSQEEPIDPAMAPANAPNPRGVNLDLSDHPHHVRLVAIEVAAHQVDPVLVPALIEALRDSDALLRDRAARALQRITNHSTGLLWADTSLDAQALEQGVNLWRQWWTRLGKKKRDTWLVEGFRAKNFQIGRLDRKALWELARATMAPEHLSYNAQRALMRITDHKPRSLQWPKHDACWHWTRWLKKRQRQYRLSEVPPALQACNK